MKAEDIKKLEKGRELLDLIDSYKFSIEELENVIQEHDVVEGGTLYVETEEGSKGRLRLSKELTLKVMDEVLAEYKATVEKLKKEFEEL